MNTQDIVVIAFIATCIEVNNGKKC